MLGGMLAASEKRLTTRLGDPVTPRGEPVRGESVTPDIMTATETY
jgi:hypothetical protein